MKSVCEPAQSRLYIYDYSPPVGVNAVLWHYGTDLWFVSVTFKDDNYGAEEVESLKSLVLNLRQLLDLHQKYNCRLSLSVFEKVWILLVTYFRYVYASNSNVWNRSHDKPKFIIMSGLRLCLKISVEGRRDYFVGLQYIRVLLPKLLLSCKKFNAGLSGTSYLWGAVGSVLLFRG